MDYLSSVRVLDTDYKIKDEEAARINHTHKFEEIEGAAKEGHKHQASEIDGLSTVATSGRYSDLSGRPSAATENAAGLMSAADKKKLDGVAEGANKYVHPTSESGANAAGLYKFSTDAQGHVTSAAAATKEDISTLESDPTVPTWAKQPLKPDYDFSEIKNATPISIDYINSL